MEGVADALQLDDAERAHLFGDMELEYEVMALAADDGLRLAAPDDAT